MEAQWELGRRATEIHLECQLDWVMAAREADQVPLERALARRAVEDRIGHRERLGGGAFGLPPGPRSGRWGAARLLRAPVMTALRPDEERAVRERHREERRLPVPRPLYGDGHRELLPWRDLRRARVRLLDGQARVVAVVHPAPAGVGGGEQQQQQRDDDKGDQGKPPPSPNGSHRPPRHGSGPDPAMRVDLCWMEKEMGED